MKICLDCDAVIDRRAIRCMRCVSLKRDKDRRFALGNVVAKTPGGPPKNTCDDCGRPIWPGREVCGACDWARTRPERLLRRAARRAS